MNLIGETQITSRTTALGVGRSGGLRIVAFNFPASGLYRDTRKRLKWMLVSQSIDSATASALHL